MKLEDICCTLQQAKRLKELGIEQVSYFVWGENANVITEGWSIEGIEDTFYAAYNVSEICGVLPDLIISNNLQYELVIVKESEDAWLCQYSRNNNLLDSLQHIDRVYRKTMAETVAYMLIHLLELGKVTAEECNKRLTDI